MSKHWVTQKEAKTGADKGLLEALDVSIKKYSQLSFNTLGAFRKRFSETQYLRLFLFEDYCGLCIFKDDSDCSTCLIRENVPKYEFSCCEPWKKILDRLESYETPSLLSSWDQTTLTYFQALTKQMLLLLIKIKYNYKD